MLRKAQRIMLRVAQEASENGLSRVAGFLRLASKEINEAQKRIYSRQKTPEREKAFSEFFTILNDFFVKEQMPSFNYLAENLRVTINSSPIRSVIAREAEKGEIKEINDLIAKIGKNVEEIKKIYGNRGKTGEVFKKASEFSPMKPISDLLSHALGFEDAQDECFNGALKKTEIMDMFKNEQDFDKYVLKNHKDTLWLDKAFTLLLDRYGALAENLEKLKGLLSPIFDMDVEENLMGKKWKEYRDKLREKRKMERQKTIEIPSEEKEVPA